MAAELCEVSSKTSRARSSKNEGSPSECPQLEGRSANRHGSWVDPASREALLLLLLEDLRGSPCRSQLLPNIWQDIAAFLRLPQQMRMLYLFGGRQRAECLDTAEAFDWWHGEWIPLPSMSCPRVGVTAAVLGDRIIVAGGYSERGTRPLDTAEAYDPQTGSWEALACMPTCRYGLALVPLGGRIYAIGGDDGEQVSVANEAYDPQTNSWTRAADLPRALTGGKSIAHGGHIYYVGGCDQFESLSAETYMYSPEADKWSFALVPGTKDRLRLKTPRTSFAMTLLEVPPSDGPSWLMVTGGVAVRPDEFFLADTELLPIGSASTGFSGGELPWLLPGGVPRMPHPRSGCRSVALWFSPGRPFHPWAADAVGSSDSQQGARPFVLVLGGETLEGDQVISCEEPLVLDMARGHWHRLCPPKASATATATATAEDAGSEEPAARSDPPSSTEDDAAFFSLAAKLRTSRVAFAITVFPQKK